MNTRFLLAGASALIFVCACGGNNISAQNTNATNLASGATIEVSSTLSADYSATKIVDGIASNDSRWLSAKQNGPHTITLQLKTPGRIGAIQVASGWEVGGTWQDAIRDFAVQYRKNGTWTNVPEGTIVANTKPFLNITLAQPIETDALRLVVQDVGSVRLAEVRAYAPAPTYPTLELKTVGSKNTVVVAVPPVFVNQSGYDLDGTKRFTAPTLTDGTPFTVRSAAQSVALPAAFSGVIRGGIGDFTAFRPQDTTHDWVVEAGGLRSDAFRVAPLWIERVSLDPALRFMVDARSVVGTHPSAYGGMPWRDGIYYGYELPSLVMLYLANPDYYERTPIEINYAQDKSRALSPDFKLTPAANDKGVMDAVRSYYTELDAPVGERVPDIVQLIHWGIGWHLVKPVSADPSGDPTGWKIHSQTVEQFAFMLYAYPQLKGYFSDSFYKRAHDFAFEQWPKVGLFDVDKTYGGFDSFKGRHAPGHSVLPNLLMYEVAKREKRTDAERYLNAAVQQAQWVLTLDPAEPNVTKGQRMSEHMTMTGLTTLMRNYPQQAPAGLKAWLDKWADTAIARSSNEWDFRRYDAKEWSLPRNTPGSHGGAGWNEPGNLAGFPACAIGVADSISDPQKSARLQQVATAQWDALFGRNPVGAHSADHGPQDWIGVERGWPQKFGLNNCARLELVRGTLNSCAATEHYPYNPKGAFRHPEGWTAFNAAFNVALAYTIQDKTKLTLWNSNFTVPLESSVNRGTIGVELVAPLSTPTQIAQDAKVNVTLPDGTISSVVLKRADADGTRFRGTLTLSKEGEAQISYGYGWLATQHDLRVK